MPIDNRGHGNDQSVIHVYGLTIQERPRIIVVIVRDNENWCSVDDRLNRDARSIARLIEVPSHCDSPLVLLT